jgi:hypothetical protein
LDHGTNASKRERTRLGRVLPISPPSLRNITFDKGLERKNRFRLGIVPNPKMPS